MKIRSVSLVPALLLLAWPVSGRAADEVAATGWHAQTLGQALGYMVLFSAVGIIAAIAGYKLFDKCTPGDLHNEIVQHKNVAAAIVAAAVILGVCIIIAAAMLG
jgi:putative membrane protein